MHNLWMWQKLGEKSEWYLKKIIDQKLFMDTKGGPEREK